MRSCFLWRPSAGIVRVIWLLNALWNFSSLTSTGSEGAAALIYRTRRLVAFRVVEAVPRVFVDLFRYQHRAALGTFSTCAPTMSRSTASGSLSCVRRASRRVPSVLRKQGGLECSLCRGIRTSASAVWKRSRSRSISSTRQDTLTMIAPGSPGLSFVGSDGSFSGLLPAGKSIFSLA